MNKDESKRLLSSSFNCKIRVTYIRVRKHQFHIDKKHQKSILKYNWDMVGLVKEVRAGSIVFCLDDDYKVTLFYGNIKNVEFIHYAGHLKLRERYLMNKI